MNSCSPLAPFLLLGIHYGQVIAGVIGHHKPQFSLIGDTVNTTSRVCSKGKSGEITISTEAYERIKDKMKFVFSNPIEVFAKGKGDIVLYELKKFNPSIHRSKRRRRESQRMNLTAVTSTHQIGRATVATNPRKQTKIILSDHSKSPPQLNNI